MYPSKSIIKKIFMSSIFEKEIEYRLNNISEDIKRYSELYFDLLDAVHQELKQQNITQADLAKSTGKYPSEIHKWFSGDHNFTLKSIIKLELALGCQLITIAIKEKAKASLEQTISKQGKVKSLNVEKSLNVGSVIDSNEVKIFPINFINMKSVSDNIKIA